MPPPSAPPLAHASIPPLPRCYASSQLQKFHEDETYNEVWGDAHEALHLLVQQPPTAAVSSSAHGGAGFAGHGGGASCAAVHSVVDLTTGVANWSSSRNSSNQTTVRRPGWTRPVVRDQDTRTAPPPMRPITPSKAPD